VIEVGVRPEVTVVVPPLLVERPMPGSDDVCRAAREMGATPGEPIVIGCGEAAWRKGTDLFVELARRLSARPDLRFAWIGRRLRAFARRLDHDVEACGLAARMCWLGDVADPDPYLAAATVLVAPSRHDPQPLVPLEAARLGVPTACFALGGLGELSTAGAAVAVPYPDTRALASAVGHLIDARDEREQIVAGARRRASTQAPGIVVPQVLAELRRVGLAGGTQPSTPSRAPT
jgi:glycosyltransferase involved in cell wall biosynthesis